MRKVMVTMTRIEALEILGLKATASLEDIKTAYSELSKNCHPEEEPERFEELHEAFSYLYRSGRRDARRKAVISLEENNDNNDSHINQQVEEESFLTRRDIEKASFIARRDIEEASFITSRNNNEESFITGCDESEEDESDDITRIVQDSVEPGLDLYSDEDTYLTRLKDEEAAEKQKRLNESIKDAIIRADMLYKKALRSKFCSSYTCMKDVFKGYEKDVYSSDVFLDKLCIILEDNRIDNSFHRYVADKYGFIEHNAYINVVPQNQKKVFDAVKKRWNPAYGCSRTLLVLGMILMIEIWLITLTSLMNSYFALFLMIGAPVLFIININCYEKLRTGLKKSFNIMLMSFMVLLIFWELIKLDAFAEEYKKYNIGIFLQYVFEIGIMLAFGTVFAINTFKYVHDLISGQKETACAK
jgi:curved DNA-binding protein CbpA